jgi:dTDP-4-amino-4,6-dideoxygalactose transaminase
MSIDTYRAVRDFEQALCDYTGSRYAVTVTSCTAALLLACAWHVKHKARPMASEGWPAHPVDTIEIPKRTYVGVGMSICHAGARVAFRDEQWVGGYQLKPYPVWDYARRFTSRMYRAGEFHCVSFHWAKILGISQGGAILHDDALADAWLRRARFDGRTEGVPPSQDTFAELGYHFYMAPETAAHGLMRLANLPETNADLPWDAYPDLSVMACFK